ncbi:predicted protein [Nematostella vectensis]|uniref:G-protein coupled receptors family 1 profile domain-containing protein n=1 Tax=Nematostella vectensis TaxID=45351 RepID=A7SBI5_NEMVE|nr:alpha-1B adrenergic receptor [Nematostella vectensis]XP_032235603.1 alpha-1B adrenergic receptor [Nematostella vectensis]XP_032235604.1 alpha-1B adrenergic receptor [Nematostella vectensis]XP_032235605.1 alpha-1B adrenergic receptor [Nematostella vectensis]XP_048585351.1 alpha-1B adrenergic receptor [Nematostella vectensis]EDO38951.1 predicted protein [Nematostella vectensis]|eukprot:XP_001631014.1 predicted protein [Nematostella vectensis]
MNSSSGMNMRRLCTEYLLSKNVDMNFDYASEIAIIAINSVLTLPTIALNLFVITTIIKTPSLRKPSNILLCMLAFTDLGVGVIIQPLYIVRKIAVLMEDLTLYCRLLQCGDILAHLICVPSFFIVTATSVDRYLAITTGVRYRQIVTTFRVICAGIGSFMLAVLVTMTRILANKEKFMSLAALVMFACLCVIIYSYTKSVTALKNLQNKVAIGSPDSSGRKQARCVIDVDKYKHALGTLVMVTTVLFFCYIPFVSVVIGIAINGRSRSMNTAREATFSLLYLNSCLTPMVYSCRSKELREAGLRLLRLKRRGSDPTVSTTHFDQTAIEM